MHKDSYCISSNQTYTKVAALSRLNVEKTLFIMNRWLAGIIWTPVSKEKTW